ncbi:30S ribosomal protein S3 [candidate division WWE3 bacterium RIFCSPHIGHO2_12_FULL_38_15]|uniref:Small ribosomal subunit protein uS3 n=1 Tax=candidate division WWE3 bacterium RIFCSPHIGHO2_02_FULL_38_14 TaxID=1802620 RepID=A0A1F4VBW6_UNCKA|nr:MAG: 30S ribosomal protein S3 [candidate division WWE3 bacterium RIFCSPHIGHO2_01_FULL_38_45]OGC49081.1 MAG: 30S ribosomal protein S3 [candidate division WWE3 bacterium RIFCSPHIGHO2_12_FULL_38_15]OGC53536.1 MAG: 30S ribosomal protein S3 [candidate division WWE3 bacterium RIFCSPLOWO2_01_FULL_37_24]OGC54440.1 MAG: 30S ribosomal protein S3 [candidate division WWE3 bacterium RIFCSPHIGHO2_02_FULL_38_14]HLB51686.1 30S ribosomal protein S3 [Patescibacteria group bacterium]
MGQKINPYGYRLGISKNWMSRWYSDKKQYGDIVLEDMKIRKYLEKKFEMAGVKSIEIERSVNEVNIIVKVAKPGVVIGKGGSGVEDAEKELKKITKSKIRLTAEEVKNPEVEAQLVADYISRQLKRRLPYRRIVIAAISSARDKGAKGIKIKLAGLLSGGNSISRSETFLDGSIPSQTLRADVDYAQVHCQMLFGTIGIKVWIFKGEAVI